MESSSENLNATKSRPISRKLAWILAAVSILLSALWINAIGSVAGIILGHVVLHRTDLQNPRRLAIAGIAVGWLGIAVLVIGLISAGTLVFRM